MIIYGLKSGGWPSQDLTGCLLEAHQNYAGFRARESEIRDYAVVNYGERTVTKTLLEHYSQILENYVI